MDKTAYAQEVGVLICRDLAPLTSKEFGVLADAARSIHVARMIEMGATPEAAETMQSVIDDYFALQTLVK